MIRTLQVEIDEDYFDRFGQAFFKSFYHHNKGWKLFVVDLGLNDTQRKLLSRYGEVKRYDRDQYRRWGQLTARVAAWYDLLQRSDVILHLDTDAVVLDSFESEFETFIEDDYEICGHHGRHILSNSIRAKQQAEEMLGVSDIFTSDRRQIHAGWLLLRNTKEMLDALKWFRDNWGQYSVYTTEEETGLAGIVYSRGLRYQVIGVVDCPTLRSTDDGYMIPCSLPPSNWLVGTAKFVHFAHAKYFIENTVAGPTRETYMAWLDVLVEPYAQLPWPDPEAVCGCP